MLIVYTHVHKVFLIFFSICLLNRFANYVLFLVSKNLMPSNGRNNTPNIYTFVMQCTHKDFRRNAEISSSQTTQRQ